MFSTYSMMHFYDVGHECSPSMSCSSGFFYQMSEVIVNLSQEPTGPAGGSLQCLWFSLCLRAHENTCEHRAGLTVAPSQTPTFFPSGWDPARPMTSPELQRGSSVTGSSSSLKTPCQWSFKQRLEDTAHGPAGVCV